MSFLGRAGIFRVEWVGLGEGAHGRPVFFLRGVYFFALEREGADSLDSAGPLCELTTLRMRRAGGIGRFIAGIERRQPAIAGFVVAGEELAGIGAGGGGDLCRAAFADDAPAIFAALGSEIDDPVGVADDVEVVLDDDDRVAQIGEAMQYFEELAHVVKVQAGGGLVEQIKCLSGLPLGELARQLHALRFAA